MESPDIRIRDKYRIVRKIGKGGSGVVYSGIDLETNEEVAIKLQYTRDFDMPMLEREADIYEELSGGVGIPHVRWHGTERDYHVMVSDLLGPSLEDLFNFCDRMFSLKTILLLADQLISRLEYLHSKSLLHRDIKPENFLMGLGKSGNLVHIIDFDLAYKLRTQESRDSKTRPHRPPHNDLGFVGTLRYANINAHLGNEQTRCDDLESLGYMMIYFARGSLPWQGLKASTWAEKEKLIKTKKIDIPAEDLCRDLPTEFATYLKTVRNLPFRGRPSYSNLRQLFRNLFLHKGYQHDYVYDWTIKKFFSMRGSIDPRAVLETQTSTTGKKRLRSSGNVVPTSEARPLSDHPTEQRCKRQKAK